MSLGAFISQPNTLVEAQTKEMLSLLDQFLREDSRGPEELLDYFRDAKRDLRRFLRYKNRQSKKYIN